MREQTPSDGSAAGPWAGEAGTDGDVVVSVRVRLARNLQNTPFVWRASALQRQEVIRATRDAAGAVGGLHWLELEHAPWGQRALLAERHLISRNFCDAKGARAVGLSPNETLSLMVNEEDHLRMQALRPGNALQTAFADATAMERLLSQQLDMAFDERWGYLTACPTNVGCGIRISAMVHLPGLRMAGQLEKVKRAAQELHLAVRGFAGEGSDAVADLFQVSNQVTLGVSEQSLLAEFQERILPSVVQWERQARTALTRTDLLALQDRTARGVALLQQSRLMPLDEGLKLLGRLRLGVAIDLASGLSLGQVNRLMLSIHPGHLAASADGSAAVGPPKDDRAQRADHLRREIAPVRVG